MKKTAGYFLLLFLIQTLGCLPAQKVRTVKPTETTRQTTRLEFSDELEEKIRFLDALLREKDLSEDDRKIAKNLLDTYRMLKKMSLTRPSDSDYSNIIHGLFQSLSSMDEKYFLKEKDTVAGYPSTIRLLIKKRDEILDRYLSGEYQAVIDLCIELKTVFGPDSLTPDIGLLFALSLAKKGMLDEAITIGEKIAGELETSPDSVHLRIAIAEWYLLQGQREKAILMYEKLTDIVDEKGIDVQSLSRKIALTEKPGTILGPIPGQTQPYGMKEVTVDHLLEEVEILLEENRFGEARDLLLMNGPKFHSTDSDKINQALQRLELAEEKYLEEKISMISMNRDMEQARRLLEEERYEEVISKLAAIASEEKDSPEIKELKQFAIEKLINRERNRAAQIFLSAKETKDPAMKKEYFQESLEILNTLIHNYPLSPLNQKLISHIKIVEKEIAKLEKDTGGGGDQSMPLN